MTDSRCRRGQSALVLLFNSWTLIFLGLLLFVRTLPPTPTPIPGPADAEAAWWGLWPVTYLPIWAVILGTVAVLAALVVGRRGSGKAGTGIGNWGLGIGAGFLFIAFFLFQVPHTRWGDAYILTYGIAYPDAALRLTHSWQAPLDVFLHSQMWLRFHDQFGWETARPVYQILSPLAGGIYLTVAVALGRDRRIGPGWLTFGLLTTIGVIQLFFGYVENYSFAAAGILLYLYLALGVLRGERPLWLAASVLAVVNATHPSTVVYAPSLVYVAYCVLRVAWNKDADRRFAHATRNTLHVLLPMLLVATATVLLMEAGGHGISALLTNDRPGGGDGRWLVPLFATETRWEHHTMFSWGHLRDMFNEQMLVGPVVLPGLMLAGAAWIFEKAKGKMQRAKGKAAHATRNTQHAIRNSQSAIFLTLAALSHLLLTWVWNPDYGGQRDWDLFSLALIPAALLLAYLLPRVLTDRKQLWAAALPLLTIQALHTAAWIYQNTLPWNWPA